MTSPPSAVNEIGVQCRDRSFTWATADETTLGVHTTCSSRSASPACSRERSERPAPETSPSSPTSHGKHFTEQHSTTHNAERCMRIEPERTGWARLSDLFHKYDQVRIQDVKEDIDTLLVFTGLFSAVLSGFVVVAYTALQQQPEDNTNQILAHISQQLSSLSVTGGFINSTTLPITAEPFHPSSSAVRIAALWSWSLVTSLITASFSILVKQWIHEFLARDTQDPQEQVKIRIFRDEGMRKWRVFEIAAFLPLLLQLSLLLFFTGLSEFLRELNPVVGWSTTGLMIAWLTIFIFTTLAPIFSSQCPYKTPSLKELLSAIRFAPIRLARSRLASNLQYYKSLDGSHTITQRLCLRSRRWLERLENLEEEAIGKETKSDMAILAYSNDVLRGEQLQGTTIQCARDCKQDEVNAYVMSMARKPRPEGISYWLPPPHREEDSTVSRIYLNVLSDKDNTISKLDTNVNIRTNFQDLHQNLTFAAHLIMSNSYHNQAFLTSLRPAMLTLAQRGMDTTVLALLSMYRATCRIRISGALVWRPSPLRSGCPQATSAIEVVTNLDCAMRTLLRVLWSPPQSSGPLFLDESDECTTVAHIEEARSSSRSELDADIIAITFVFSQFCWLTSKADRQNQRHVIMSLMNELADIMEKKDPEEMDFTHTRCLTDAYKAFVELDLVNDRLMETILKLHPDAYILHW